MLRRLLSLLLLALWCAALWWALDWAQRPATLPASTDKSVDYPDYFARYLLPALPVATGFNAPVRPPDGAGVTISLGFQEENHLGEDWNTAPGNKDLGEPVYSIADGWVTLAVDFQGMWGKVVMIAHRLPANDPSGLNVVEAMYAHLGSIQVQPWTFVRRGQPIGTIGNADGVYKAHLHWELRDGVGLGLGGGFSEKPDGWLNPGKFVEAHRPAEATGRKLKTRPVPASQRDAWGFDG